MFLYNECYFNEFNISIEIPMPSTSPKATEMKSNAASKEGK